MPHRRAVRIETLEPCELRAVLQLLQRSGLPAAGLGEQINTLVFGGRHDGRLVASAALELFGEDALLRSVAVAVEARGLGLGRRLTRHAVRTAKALGVGSVYLLTETADAFFARLGFHHVDRADVPAGVQRSVEFTSACPAGARAMVRRFGALWTPASQWPPYHAVRGLA